MNTLLRWTWILSNSELYLRSLKWTLVYQSVQAAITITIDYMAWPTDTYFSLFWKLGCPRSRCLQVSCLVRVCPLAYRWTPLLYPYMVESEKEREEASSLMSPSNIANLITSAPTSWITSQRLHLRIPSLWGLNFNTWNGIQDGFGYMPGILSGMAWRLGSTETVK